MQSAMVLLTSSDSLLTATFSTTPSFVICICARTITGLFPTKTPLRWSMWGLEGSFIVEVPSQAFIPKKSITAVTASERDLNWRANFSSTSCPFPSCSHDLLKSPKLTLATKSLVEISSPSIGYSSSNASPSSSPVMGSTSTMLKWSSQSMLHGVIPADSSLSRTTKQLPVSPYLICSHGTTPLTVSIPSSPPSVATVTLSSLWLSTVFWTLNWRTTPVGKMCLTQRTTYSVSLSVRGTGGEDLKTLPRSASSGIA
mmetsp:Transcript_22266/g.46268  ORF Transcript_22266/g.46268 Transcript_22266/m.46268 type:complete len:256 (+) Transcript_22266:53-820(+)